MRVIIVSGIFPPDIGGPATHARDLQAEFTGRGHNARVLALADRVRGHDDSNVVRVPRWLPWPVRMVVVVAYLLVRRSTYDVVYATGLGPAAVLGARIARRPVALKIVGDPAWERSVRENLTDHSFDEFQDEARGAPPRLRAMRALRNWSVRSADQVLTPGAALGRTVERWIGGRGRIRTPQVIPNGARRAAAGGPAPATSGARLDVLFVGRLVGHKHVDQLVAAVAMVDDIVLEIVGDGPERAALEQQAESLGVADRVRFAGPLQKDATAARIAAADALLLASSYEGLPHVVLEALVNGTPVVTSPTPGSLEVVSHQENGLVADPPDASGFADCLTRLRDDADLVAALAAGATESGLLYRFEVTADRIEQLLGDLDASDQPPKRRPRVVFLGKSRIPVEADMQAKVAIHDRHLESWTVNTGAPGVRRIGRTRALAFPSNGPGPLVSALFYVVAPFVAVGLAVRRRRSAIVCQSPYEGLGAVLVSRLIPGRRRPAIQIEIHGDWKTATRLYGSGIRRLVAPAADRVAEWAIVHADRVRVVSELLGEMVVATGYTGVVDRHIAYSDYETFLDRPVVPAPDRPIAVFVGVLEPYKAVDVLLDSWVAVVRRVEGAELRLVGAGPQDAWLRSRAAELGIDASVSFVGRVPRTEVATQIDDATCLVLPSRSEGLPRIVVEALSRSRPVVASTVGGMAELIEDDVTGRLVPSEDVHALVEALVDVLGDRTHADEMGAEGRSRMLARDPLREYEQGIEDLAGWVHHR